MGEQMSEREMWLAIYSALLGMADAIARHWLFGKYAPSKVVKPLPSDSMAIGNAYQGSPNTLDSVT